MLTWKEVTRRPSVREGSPMHTGDSRLGRKSAPSDMQGITCRPSVMEGSSMHTGYSRHGNKSRPSGRKSHARKHHITPIARLSCSHGRKSHVAPLSWKEVPCTLATPDMEISLAHLEGSPMHASITSHQSPVCHAHMEGSHTSPLCHGRKSHARWRLPTWKEV